MNEPIITINGTTLTEPQAMTVRVALSNFVSQMATAGALGSDDVGEDIRRGYEERSGEVIQIMLTPPPSTYVVGDLDYCFDPENWEFTCSWPERDQVHGYGESLKPGQPMRVCTLLKGPDKWVADVPITWDEDGEPDETEIKWFDSEEEARAALATTEGSDNA